MLEICLTGGIATGKSLVAEHFHALEVPIADSDLVAREVVEPGSAGLDQVIEAFGEEILAPDGRLDRGSLRRRIFDDDTARQTLEAILHPLIRARIDECMHEWAAQGHAYALRVVPLLVETGAHRDCHYVLVVDAPPALQIERLQKRDNADESQSRAILVRQATRWQRLAIASDVIDNGDTVDPETAIGPQVLALHRKYLALAQQKTGQRTS